MRRSIPPFWIPLIGSLLQFFGFHWDIVWHVALGRDSFWSPPHLVLYLGVGLVLMSAAMPVWKLRGRSHPGHVVLLAGAVAQVLSAPFDELWHRLFGIDTTIWSPPHLLLVFGGSLTPLGLVLLVKRSAYGRGNAAAGIRSLARGVAGVVFNRTFLLFGLFLGWLDVTLVEFRLHIPPPFWPWDYALYPPLALGAALLAGVAAFTATRRAGAITAVILAFTVLLLLLNMTNYVLLLRRLWWPASIPLLLPGAVVADLLLVGLVRAPRLIRLSVAGLGFAVAFYAAQYAYVVAYPSRAWQTRMLTESWPLALVLTVVSVVVGAAIGRWIGAVRGQAGAWSSDVPSVAGASRARETREGAETLPAGSP